MTWVALLGLLAAPQQDQTVFRTEKGDYPVAVRECQAAEALIDSDPRGAIEKLDAILNNTRIKKVECRLRIEERPAEYSPWTLFLPYQFRGRARLNLAKKAEREAGEKLLAGAVDDLQKSVEAGVKSSEDLLKAARAELEKLRAAAADPGPGVPVDPVARFAPGFQQLLRLNKFKSARARLDTDGKDLTDAQRKTFVDEAERRCRLYLGEQVEEFRRRLARLGSLRDLQEMAGSAFDALFELPAPDELVVTDPSVEWGRAHVAAFKEVRAGRAGGEVFLPAAAAAAAVAPEGPNPWFPVVENLAFQGVRDGILSAVEKARDAAKAERDAQRARAEGLLKQWEGFAAGLDAKFRERHPFVKDHSNELAGGLRDFPVELADLDKVDLESFFAEAEPLAKLGKQEKDLREMEGGKAIARESRQKLYVAIVPAAAIRMFAEGATENGVVKDLEAYGEKLKKLKDPVDVRKFGPRIEKVFQELLK